MATRLAFGQVAIDPYAALARKPGFEGRRRCEEPLHGTLVSNASVLLNLKINPESINSSRCQVGRGTHFRGSF